MNYLVLLLTLTLCSILVESKYRYVPKFSLFRTSTGQASRLHLASVKAIELRGGARDNDEDRRNTLFGLDEKDEDEDEEDDSDSDGHFQKRDIAIVNTISNIWNKTPPVTQIYVGSSIAITLLSFVFNKNVWPKILDFSWPDILGGQLWRIISSFLYFGQLDLFYPLTMQFVWQHMTQLEKLSYNKPEDFAMMLLFGAGALISIYSCLGISMKYLGHNLATFLVYIWSRVFEGSDVNFMDFIVLKSEMLPWVFCAQTFLLEQELPVADLIGIAVGHLFYYLKNKNMLEAPDFLRAWFQSEKVKARYALFKGDFL